MISYSPKKTRSFNIVILDIIEVNAGAILTVSLLQKLVKPEMSMAAKFDYIMNYFKRCVLLTLSNIIFVCPSINIITLGWRAGRPSGSTTVFFWP